MLIFQYIFGDLTMFIRHTCSDSDQICLANIVQFVAFLVAGWFFVLAPADVTFATPVQSDNQVGIKNGSFKNWKEGLPVGWEVGIGADNGGSSPLSKVQKGAAPSLVLSGDASTMAWRMVKQELKLTPGTTYRLSYSAKANNLKREGSQFDNCYVGIFLTEKTGAFRVKEVWPVTEPEFTTKSSIMRGQKDVGKLELGIFLSKSGQLTVKDFKLEALKPADSFDLLVKDMARKYSFFRLKNIDWAALSAKYKERAEAAKTPDEFATVVGEMLDELKDIHTWAEFRGKRYSNFSSGFDANYDFNIVKSNLKSIDQIGKFGIVGMTKSGFCYVNIQTLAGVSNADIREMTDQIIKNNKAPGFIVDLRRNSGGAENPAKLIAGLFTRKEIVFAKSLVRKGDNPDDFSEPNDRTIWKTRNVVYDGPIIALSGPGAVSSAEAMVMMFKSLPNCTVIGKTTRGASGNPASILLPNGVDVYYSRWQSLETDGTCIEGVGVKPNIEVEHEKGSDKTYTKAVEMLLKKTK